MDYSAQPPFTLRFMCNMAFFYGLRQLSRVKLAIDESDFQCPNFCGWHLLDRSRSTAVEPSCWKILNQLAAVPIENIIF